MTRSTLTLAHIVPAFVFALSLSAFAPASAATLVAQATPQEACSNLGGRIRGDYCVIDTVFCNAARLAAESVCIGRDGELIDLSEVITGPREVAPTDRETRG